MLFFFSLENMGPSHVIVADRITALAGSICINVARKQPLFNRGGLICVNGILFYNSPLNVCGCRGVLIMYMYPLTIYC